MTYSELKTVVQDLHTGGPLAASMGTITKMVLGKIARMRPKMTRQIAEVSTSGSREIPLSSEIPDFMAIRKDINKGKDIYYYEGDVAIFLTLASYNKFKSNEYDRLACIYNGTLYLSKGIKVPDTIYVPYHSYYLVLDKDGSTRKSKPIDSDDTFLIDDVYEDVLVDGVLLYLKRRELDNSEFTKSSKEWERQLQSLISYN